jgi:hypothetical protein
VVYQGWERQTGCQFSFTCDGALLRSPIPVLWQDDRKVAEAALDGYVQASVGVATHYHADYVAPYWAPSLVKLSQIGAHIFYRWPGNAGLPQAFNARYQGGELALSEAVLTGRAARPTPPAEVIRAAEIRPGAVPELPTLRTVEVADAGGAVKTRVTASFEPAQYGRRQPTTDEIARINAMLEQRFPSQTGAQAAPKPEATAPAEPTVEASSAPPAPLG